MRKWLAAGAVLMAASPAYAIFQNGGFETGNYTGWTQTAGINQGLTGSPPFTSASLNIGAGGTFRSTVVGATPDPRAPQLTLPRAGAFTALVNHPTQAGGILNSISQQDVITNADRDAGDSKLHVRFSYAPVLNDSGHADNQRPFFFVRLRNITKSTTLYEDFAYEQQPGKTFILGNSGYRYQQFQNVDIVVPDADLGDTLEIQALASDCSPTAHPGYVYLDGFGSAVVGPPGGAATPTAPIPTLSEWGLILLALGIGGVTILAQRRSRYH
ncbi:MAG: IPTL-CTERM sorting domain-containing protein [Casimicrobiaceae bacterium]